jgi:GT2 family glycosyltransferase
MAKAIKVSVIIPAFNQAALTRQCLETILGRDEAEVIVVDDASTDGTAQMLAAYGGKIKVVAHKLNSGFAKSCNDGANIARGKFLVFLNNDTVPQRGWLAALVDHAEKNRKAAVVGAKLVYPNNTVQHAGVVICQDGYPRHIYTGFAAGHPAVSKSRRFQVVTAAAMLVRREIFKAAGGFDTRFRNGFEDVDLCLRLGERGHEIHYCAGSVVKHLESVSPGRFKHDRHNVDLYRRRWHARVQPDDLGFYLADGLLGLTYEGSFPFHLKVSPELAVLDTGRRGGVEKALAVTTRQVAELIRENTKLRAELGGAAPASPALEYERLRARIRETVNRVVPPGAKVLVISKGDGALLELDGRDARHFPQSATGGYAGYHPADGKAAVAALKKLMPQAGYLVIPQTSRWWLDHYPEFRGYLTKRFTRLKVDPKICNIYILSEDGLSL